jgi:hypothetical protein
MNVVDVAELLVLNRHQGIGTAASPFLPPLRPSPCRGHSQRHQRLFAPLARSLDPVYRSCVAAYFLLDDPPGPEKGAP